MKIILLYFPPIGSFDSILFTFKKSLKVWINGMKKLNLRNNFRKSKCHFEEYLKFQLFSRDHHRVV